MFQNIRSLRVDIVYRSFNELKFQKQIDRRDDILVFSAFFITSGYSFFLLFVKH